MYAQDLLALLTFGSSEHFCFSKTLLIQASCAFLKLCKCCVVYGVQHLPFFDHFLLVERRIFYHTSVVSHYAVNVLACYGVPIESHQIQ